MFRPTNIVTNPLGGLMDRETIWRPLKINLALRRQPRPATGRLQAQCQIMDHGELLLLQPKSACPDTSTSRTFNTRIDLPKREKLTSRIGTLKTFNSSAEGFEGRVCFALRRRGLMF
jgi:hypothetical protein